MLKSEFRSDQMVIALHNRQIHKKVAGGNPRYRPTCFWMGSLRPQVAVRADTDKTDYTRDLLIEDAGSSG
jgi:hypothetical protein